MPRLDTLATQPLEAAAAHMRTLGKALEETRGVGPGFDTLRVVLSISILFWHGIQISNGVAAETKAWDSTFGGFLAASLLPIFFALSGFLVIGSALRTRSLRTFLTFRVLRIVPALSTEVVLSALVLGPALTIISLPQYFTSPEFFRYFANTVGWITFTLPGVFTTNPSPFVNLSLWTIPPELTCYLFIAICIGTGIYKSRSRMMLVMIALLCIISARKILSHSHLITALPAQDNLFLCFVLGNIFYHYRDRILLDWRLFIASTGFGIFCIHSGVLIYAGSVLLTYSMVYLGMTKLPKLPLFSRGDYSYGIYLYGFPVQQTIAYLFPDTRIWFLNALLALPIVVLLAMVSWHCIEYPALALKRKLQRSAPQKTDVMAPPAALEVDPTIGDVVSDMPRVVSI
jgi:peptidoglycan/LPS O-acetylase OafA/YrhL